MDSNKEVIVNMYIIWIWPEYPSAGSVTVIDANGAMIISTEWLLYDYLILTDFDLILFLREKGMAII